MLNLFEMDIDSENQEMILAVKRLDQGNLQKFANFISAIRAMIGISRTNWYYGFALDNNDSENPLICGFQDALGAMQDFTKLEFTEITGQATANTLERIAQYRELIESTLEKTPISKNNTFTGQIAFARQVLPVLMMAGDSLEAIYQEAQKNVLATLELQALQDLRNSQGASGEIISEEVEYLILKEKVLRFSRLFMENPSTAKALLGANLSEILEQSARFMVSRGQSLTTEISHPNNTNISA